MPEPSRRWRPRGGSFRRRTGRHGARLPSRSSFPAPTFSRRPAARPFRRAFARRGHSLQGRRPGGRQRKRRFAAPGAMVQLALRMRRSRPRARRHAGQLQRGSRSRSGGRRGKRAAAARGRGAFRRERAGVACGYVAWNRAAFDGRVQFALRPKRACRQALGILRRARQQAPCLEISGTEEEELERAKGIEPSS